ncbi:hypothetical protein AOLI_G00127520 [Acnodon oligacanthus]
MQYSKLEGQWWDKQSLAKDCDDRDDAVRLHGAARQEARASAGRPDHRAGMRRISSKGTASCSELICFFKERAKAKEDGERDKQRVETSPTVVKTVQQKKSEP